MPALPREPGPGDRVAGHRLLKEWSRGEGVVTFEALQEERGEPVLLSLYISMRSDDPDVEDQIRKEAERVQAVEAAHFAPLVEWGLEEGIPYLAHRASGRSLRSWIDGKRRAQRKGRELPDVEKWAMRLADLAEDAGRLHEDRIGAGGISASDILLAADEHLVVVGLGRAGWYGGADPRVSDVRGLLEVVSEIAGLAAPASSSRLQEIAGRELTTSGELASELRLAAGSTPRPT
ncbi:MAG: hypothetical protein O7H41_10525 [Planctomycetota bacterium]|nr:hypothetical protein [Planctomycetota bacterium]